MLLFPFLSSSKTGNQVEGREKETITNTHESYLPLQRTFQWEPAYHGATHADLCLKLQEKPASPYQTWKKISFGLPQIYQQIYCNLMVHTLFFGNGKMDLRFYFILLYIMSIIIIKKEDTNGSVVFNNKHFTFFVHG